MSKKEFVASMILAIYMVAACLFAAIYGLITPDTTTPWFWFTGSALFTVSGAVVYFRNKSR